MAGFEPVADLPLDRDGAELSVVVCDDYLTCGLDEVDRLHRAARRPWLLAKPGGARVWIGPVFEPDGACWHCMATRLWGNRQAEAHVQDALGRGGGGPRPAGGGPGWPRPGGGRTWLRGTRAARARPPTRPGC